MRLPRLPLLLLCSLALVVLQFVVYAPALQNGFVRYDDDTYVYENDHVKTLTPETVSWMFAQPYFKSYTPLALLSHAIDYAVWGEKPWGHHLASLLLHSVNVLFVFFLGVIILSLRRDGKPGVMDSGLLSRASPGVIAGACVAALLYALHPVRVESVAWISDRKDLLLALFLIPGLIAYIKYDAARGKGTAVCWFLTAVVFNVLALLSKSVATVTPLLLLLLDGLLLHRGASGREWKTLILEKAPFFLLSLGFGLLAMWAAHGSQMNDIVVRMTLPQRILMPFYTLTFYPAKYLFPADLTPIYDSVSVGWMAVGLLVTLIAFVASIGAARHGHTGWLLALTTYAITISPTITGLSAGIQPWADRYSYVPSIALFILIGGGIALIWERSRLQMKSAVIGGVVALVILFALVDRVQISIWKDSVTFWRAAVSRSPALPITYANLGVALAERGHTDSALAMYRKAIALQPNYAVALYNTAIAFESDGKRDSAMYYYTRALYADTGYVDAYVNLGNLLAGEGNRETAILLYKRALALDVSDTDAYYNLGCVLYLSGDRGRALEAFRQAILFSPGNAKAYYNLGIVFLDLQREDAALESFIRAARLGSPEAKKVLRGKGYSWN